jgi:hypothetical protein
MSKLDLSKWTLGELLGKLTVPQIWGICGGIAAALLAVASAGFWVGKSSIDIERLRTQNSKSETKGKRQSLIVEDVIRKVYPHMQLDFRVANTSSNQVAISRVYLLILKIETGMSPIGKQEVSDVSSFALDETVQEGDVLESDIAVTVAPSSKDRFLVTFKWSGKPQDIGYYHTVIPALKTSEGYVQCPLARLHFQQQIWPNPPPTRAHPSWDLPRGQKAPLIDWSQEVMIAKPSH